MYIDFIKKVIIKETGKPIDIDAPQLKITGKKCKVYLKDYICNLTFLFSISGGGGCGKTYLMRVLSAWVEKIKRKHGDDPTSPKCLLLAPTGVASSLIGKNISFFTKLNN